MAEISHLSLDKLTWQIMKYQIHVFFLMVLSYATTQLYQ